MLHVYDIEKGVLRERDVAELTPGTSDAASWIDLTPSSVRRSSDSRTARCFGSDY